MANRRALNPFWLIILLGSACGGDDGAAAPADAAVSAVDAAAATAGADANVAETGITFTTVGAPIFRITGCNVYSTPIGTPSDSSPWVAALSAVFPGHRYDQTHNLFMPGQAHQPPYDDEATRGVAAAGFTPGLSFQVADWTQPRGLTVSCILVPTEGAPTGRSPDYESGPVLDKSLEIDGDLYLGETLVDTEFDSTKPVLPSLLPRGEAVTHWSHVLLNFGENTGFIAGVPGAYDLRVSIFQVESTGERINQQAMHVRFRIVP
jgi:hypothetical protein